MEPPSSSPTRFAWVRKRDGRVVPFESDKISRALFAASEAFGRPDAFLARELTDSILHFLDAESRGTTPTTEQISDLIIKVVRELGQPALAKAFAEAQGGKSQRREAADTSPAAPATRAPSNIGPSLSQLREVVESQHSPADLRRSAAGICLRDYSLQEVFTRDLVAAQADGLLTLTGLETPLELAGRVLTFAPDGGVHLVEAAWDARSTVGSLLVLDGPEYVLARGERDTDRAADFARCLKLALRVTGLHAVVNLHCAVPPPDVKELAMGPLFETHGRPALPEQWRVLQDALLEQLLLPELPAVPIRVDWHLGPGDFVPEASGVLVRLARRALEGAPLAFVFHRSRRPLPLAEGMDRQNPAVLLVVGLHLPRLIELARPAIDASSFLQKLGSLARMALSAGTQKRDFLRRHGKGRSALTAAFLLERARLIVVPIGLEWATQMLTGQNLCAGGSALEYVREMVKRLQEVLRQDGRASLLETGLDSVPGGLSLPGCPDAGKSDAVGLSPWDATATPKSQLRAAGLLHAIAEMGTASVLLPEDQPVAAEDIVDLLRYACQQTEVVRVCFVRRDQPTRQLTVPWEPGSDTSPRS